MSDVSNNLIDLSNQVQYVDGMIITENLVAIDATGGFAIDISLSDITLVAENPIRIFDLTETLQLDFDVRIFNTKLGLVKDASNVAILDTSFNVATNTFPNNSLTLTFEEFNNHLTASQVNSLGKFSTLYSDFKQYINHYFYYSNNFNSLLSSLVNLCSVKFNVCSKKVVPFSLEDVIFCSNEELPFTSYLRTVSDEPKVSITSVSVLL